MTVKRHRRTKKHRKGGSNTAPIDIPDNISEIGSNENFDLDDSMIDDLDLGNTTDTETVSENSLNLSENESQGPLSLSDLNDSQGTMTLSELNVSQPSSQNTTAESVGFGGSKRRRHHGKRKTMKKRNTKRNKKSKSAKSRKSRKMRGGSNLGSNCNDPNFSIFNTNMLKLFPYLPNKPN